MAGIFVGKSTTGQLPAAIADLLLAAAGEILLIKNISLVNDSGGAVTTNLYLKKSGGTARKFWEKDYSLAAKAQANYSDIIILEAGDAIQGDASSAASIDFTISYVRET